MDEVSKSDITIRHLRVDDLNEIQGLYALQVDSDDNPLTRIDVNPKAHAWEMRRLRQQLIVEQRYIVYVAVASEPTGERIVGYAGAILTEQARLFAVDLVATVSELWVLPEYRHRGIGRGLIEELFTEIDNHGISWVTVQFPEKATDTREFFKKFGFEQKTVEMQMCLEKQ
ncbi:MAG: GNAT family N-acetyltransferase [Proteobacteria bacterium]|nr:GNAT family N-acetyltransferase [Pseudomonadota bacterium]